MSPSFKKTKKTALKSGVIVRSSNATNIDRDLDSDGSLTSTNDADNQIEASDGSGHKRDSF